MRGGTNNTYPTAARLQVVPNGTRRLRIYVAGTLAASGKRRPSGQQGGLACNYHGLGCHPVHTQFTTVYIRSCACCPCRACWLARVQR